MFLQKECQISKIGSVFLGTVWSRASSRIISLLFQSVIILFGKMIPSDSYLFSEGEECRSHQPPHVCDVCFLPLDHHFFNPRNVVVDSLISSQSKNDGVKFKSLMVQSSWEKRETSWFAWLGGFRYLQPGVSSAVWWSCSHCCQRWRLGVQFRWTEGKGHEGLLPSHGNFGCILEFTNIRYVWWCSDAHSGVTSHSVPSIWVLFHRQPFLPELVGSRSNSMSCVSSLTLFPQKRQSHWLAPYVQFHGAGILMFTIDYLHHWRIFKGSTIENRPLCPFGWNLWPKKRIWWLVYVLVIVVSCMGCSWNGGSPSHHRFQY